MEGKVILVENNEVSIGEENGEVFTLSIEKVSFEPSIGQQVEIFGQGENRIVHLLERDQPLNQGASRGLPYPDQEGNTLLLAAFIYNVIGTVTVSWVLIPLAWMIPMTIASYKVYKGVRPNTTTLGVCTLLFCGLVSGILQLCAPKNEF